MPTSTLAHSPVRTGITTGSTAMRFPAEQALYGDAVCQGHAGRPAHHGARPVQRLHCAGSAQCHRRGGDSGSAHALANYAIGATAPTPIRPVPPQRIARGGSAAGWVHGPEECREACAIRLYGANVIRVHASAACCLSDRGIIASSSGRDDAIVAEAHNGDAKWRPTATADRAAKMALLAGVDSIEHGSFSRTTRCGHEEEACVPGGDAVRRRLGGRAPGHLPAGIAVKARAAAAQAQQMFQHAVKIGVPFAMGHRCRRRAAWPECARVSLMTKNGLPPRQALMAGTANGADLLGVAIRPAR